MASAKPALPEVPARASEKTIRLGHSPDPDDAFMHCAIATGRIDRHGYDFVEVHRDIETLNRWGNEGKLEATALSIHAYAFLADKYRLLPHGGSMGEGYGPMVVAKRPMTERGLARTEIAVPGTLTSAFLELQLAIGEFNYVVVPFDEIPKKVARGEFEAGLLIHEGQLTYSKLGLRNVLDLYRWWSDWTDGLPLPLGGNALRRDLGDAVMKDVSRVLRESILWALDPAHRAEALAHAMKFGRGIDAATADKFVGMYVNKRTVDYGADGRKAIQMLFDLGAENGYLPRGITVDWIEDGWTPPS